MEITVAGSSHNCKANKGHRIPKGTKRLTITEDRSPLNYCLPCAQVMLAKGISALQATQQSVAEALSKPSNDVDSADKTG